MRLPKAAALSLLAAACAPRPGDDARPVQPSSSAAVVADTARAITLTAGQSFDLPLSANLTTGYHWVLRQKPDSAVIALVKEEYVPFPNPHHVVGSGGTDHWTFRAVRAGSTAFTLAYVSPSGGRVGEVRTYRVTIR
jgi:predicted secreted protein